MDVLEILLAADEKIIEKLPEKEIEVTRLSEACGEPVIFKLRGMSYNRVAEIKAMASSTETAEEKVDLRILLAGVVSPNLKSKELQAKFGAPTPAELVKKMLLAGEIADISSEIERLSGYRRKTIRDVSQTEEIKKK